MRRTIGVLIGCLGALVGPGRIVVAQAPGGTLLVLGKKGSGKITPLGEPDGMAWAVTK